MKQLALLLLILASTPARAGTELHGGDDAALEFQQAFNLAMHEIETSQPELARDLAPARLREAAARARFLSVSCAPGQPCLVSFRVKAGGVEQVSVAVNDPVGKIVFINAPAWKAIRNPRVREAIALHEVASLERLEATGRYPYSSRYLARFGLAERELHSARDLAAERERARLELETRRVVAVLRWHLAWPEKDDRPSFAIRDMDVSRVFSTQMLVLLLREGYKKGRFGPLPPLPLVDAELERGCTRQTHDGLASRREKSPRTPVCVAEAILRARDRAR